MVALPMALVLPGGWQIEGLPDIVRRAGPQAAERTVEFFTAQIRNPHTRERAQAIAAHESPRTTKLYDRTADEVTLEDIEKIGI